MHADHCLEDTIVLKAIADRDLDWYDVKGIIERQHNRVDWDYVVSNLSMLCELKEDDHPLERLESLRKKR